MKKKTALVMISLLALSLILSTSLYMQETAVEAEYPPWHWKIMLAQKGANARIVGNLTEDGEYIPGSDFNLSCICELPEPQPLGQFVFAKIPTPVNANDITYIKYIDVDKDGIWDIVEPIINAPFYPTPPPDEPHTWYQHVEEGTGPLGPWMVVVQVREQPYHDDRPFFEWQLTIKQENVNAIWTGILTDGLGDPIPGTGFQINCTCTQMQCVVVRTPWCTVPRDIDFNILIYSKDGPLIDDQIHHEDITQFPWTMVKSGLDPYTGDTWIVELELTEVQMYRYILMGGEMDSAGSLGPGKALWSIGDWAIGEGTPHATRPPKLDPFGGGLNITFTQRDPITGIVKLGVPAGSYVGYNHVWWGHDSQLWYNMTITLGEQGCGYLFTGIGKDPVLGDVDILTTNNYTGVYSQKPGYEGDLMNVGPCLQDLSGPDGIPGTADDPVGDGQPDPPGSSLLYLPTTMTTYYWSTAPPPGMWLLLFSSPWPQLMTTAHTSDTVIAPASEIDGEVASADGEPWEFLAGIDHTAAEEGYEDVPVPWKHPKCNAYVTYVVTWSVLGTNTPLGWLDVLFYTSLKQVREDCVIADIDCNEVDDIYDIVKIGIAYGANDEGAGPDGVPFTGDDRPVADSNYDARADLKAIKGTIDIYDLVRCAIDYGAKLTPNCIIRP